MPHQPVGMVEMVVEARAVAVPVVAVVEPDQA